MSKQMSKQKSKAKKKNAVRTVRKPPKYTPPKWFKLDNAAKIYPANVRRRWTAMFRMSATLTEPVDPEVLQRALGVTLKRFPGMAVCLRRGVFWYYLDSVRKTPDVRRDAPYPCVTMTAKEIRECAVRVLYYKNRIAAEFFHVITDGTGGLIFLKTLTAEYLRQKYGANIPAECGVLDCREDPRPEELEDGFLRYAGEHGDSPKEPNSFHVRDTLEPDGFLHITTGIIAVEDVSSAAKKLGVSMTAYLTAAMVTAGLEIQEEQVRNPRRRRPVKVQVPINMRRFFPSETLRNFSLFVNPGIDPRLGEYSFEDIVKSIHHQMGTMITQQYLGGIMTSHVNSERLLILKIMPLFIKNIALRIAYNVVGENKFITTISNIGAVTLPDAMARRVERMDFVLGPQRDNSCNWSVLSYNGKMYISSVRSSRTAELERHFFRLLRKQGIHVLVESNQR